MLQKKMAKKTLSFILAFQIIAMPGYAADLQADRQNQIMPVEPQTNPSNQYSVTSKNLTENLITQNPIPAQTQNLELEIGPGFASVFKIALNESSKTIQIKSDGFTYNGSYDPAVRIGKATLFDQPFLKVDTVFHFGKNENGGLYVPLFTLNIKFGSTAIRFFHVYSQDGKVLSVSREMSDGNVSRMINFNFGGSTNPAVSFSIHDSLNKKSEIYAPQTDSASFQELLDRGLDMNAVEKRVKELSVKKYNVDYSNGWVITQSDKNESDWQTKFKITYKNNLISNYIVDGSQEFLIQQNQTLADLPNYRVSYALENPNDFLSNYKLIFSSSNNRVAVDFPHTKEVVLDGIKYMIELAADGKIKLNSEAFPGQSADVNEDGILNDEDLDFLKSRLDAQSYEKKCDLNHDGKLDVVDFKMLCDRYVRHLEETSTVLVVDASKGQSIAAAQAQARELIKNGMTKDLNVLIMEGTYYDTNLLLDERDSGRNGFNVIYRGYPGQAMPKLIGGKLLDPSSWVAAPELGADVYKSSFAGQVPFDFSLDTLFVNGQAIKNASSDSDRLRAVAGPPETSTLPVQVPGSTTRVDLEWTTKLISVKVMVPKQDEPAHEMKYPLAVHYERENNVVVRTIVSVYSKDGLEKIREDVYSGEVFPAKILTFYKDVKPFEINSRNEFVLSENIPSFDPQYAEVYFWSNGFVLNKINILAFDPVTRVVTLQEGLYHPLTKKMKADGTYEVLWPDDKRVSIVNSKTFLSENEYWYDSSADILFYKAKSGEKLADQTIVAPMKRQVIAAVGSIDKPITNLVLDRLDISGGAAIDRFRMSHRDLSKYDVPPSFSAVYLKNTQNVSVTNSYIHHTGAAGITLFGVSRNNVISHNEIAHTGSDGLVLNGDDVPIDISTANPNYRPRLLSEHNQLIYNNIHHIGEIFQEADGIHLVQTANNDVAYNKISHTGYNGIFMTGLQKLTMGWRAFRSQKPPADYDHMQWNYLRDNQISHNDISDIMVYGNDGGAIYTHSSGYHNEISHNHIHDILVGPTSHDNMATFGIYLDGGESSYFNINNNLVRVTDSHTVAVTMNGSHNVFTQNTLFSNQENHLLQVLSGDGVENNQFTKNVFYSTNPKHYSLVIYMMYDGKRWLPGNPVPDGSFVLNSKGTATAPDNYWMFTPKKTVTASEDNVFYTAAGGGTHSTYGVITTWNGWAGNFVNNRWELVIYRVSVNKWRTNPGPGLPAGFDLRSTFTAEPKFIDPVNGDYRLISNPLGAGIQ